jgi:translocator protein
MLRQALNVVGLIVVLVANGLANALPLNGQTTGQISDRFAVYFVPAGYVFSIWGIIYLGLIAFAAYQALPAQRGNERLRGIDYLFLLSCAANAAWIFLWHYEQFAFTLLAMGTLLLSLVAIYLRLGVGSARPSTAERWLVHVPFSVYLGWVTVATIANVTSVLYWAGWSGWGVPPQSWAIAMLLAGACITIAVILSRAGVAFALVIVWAYTGVAVKQAGAPAVAFVAIALAILVALAALAGFVRRLTRATAVS